MTYASEEPVYGVSPPLGLAYIAATLEQAGHKVEILDSVALAWRCPRRTGRSVHMGLSWTQIEQEIRRSAADVVGVSCPFTCQAHNAHKVAEIAKHVNSEAPVIFGGTHPSTVQVETLQDRNVDFLVIGEGERTFLDLIDHISRGKAVSEIDGLGFKDQGKIKLTQKSKFIDNLDILPFPARHLLPMDEYFASGRTRKAVETYPEPATTMITSRGCPSRCTFCSIHTVWNHKWRARSPSNVVDEIDHLVEKYRVRHVLFEDDNISLDKQRMIRICDEIMHRKLDISWGTPNGVSVATLDKQLLAKMKKSGCHSLSFGIESGNEYVLNELVGKGLSLKSIRNAVDWAKEADIDVTGFFILGMPGETMDTLRETISFAKSLQLDWAYFFIATPYPGTELYEVCKSKGYLRSTDETRLNPHFSAIQTETLSSEDLQRVHRRAYYEFFVHQLRSHPFRYLKQPHKLKNVVCIYSTYVWRKLLSSFG